MLPFGSTKVLNTPCSDPRKRRVYYLNFREKQVIKTQQISNPSCIAKRDRKVAGTRKIQISGYRRVWLAFVAGWIGDTRLFKSLLS